MAMGCTSPHSALGISMLRHRHPTVPTAPRVPLSCRRLAFPAGLPSSPAGRGAVPGAHLRGVRAGSRGRAGERRVSPPPLPALPPRQLLWQLLRHRQLRFG